MAKIIGIVQSCRECPNRRYDSGGVYDCDKVGMALTPDCNIPAWCPLADHPSAALVAMELELKQIKEQQAKSQAETLRLEELVRQYGPGSQMVLS